MKPPTPLAATPRSSRRSQRDYTGVKGTSEIPLPDSSEEVAKIPAKAGSARLKSGEEKETPAKSRKWSAAEAATGTEEQTPVENRADTNKVKQRKNIKTEEVEAEQLSPAADTTTKSKKRKIEKKSGATKLNGHPPQGSKRRRTTKVEEVGATENEAPHDQAERRRVDAGEDNIDGEAVSPKRKRKTKVKAEAEEEEGDIGGETVPAKTKRKTKVKEEEEELDENGEPIKKIKRKRKTKEEKEAEAMPLAARTDGLRMFIGAHVSCAKGIHNSVTNCVHIGGNAFAMFLKSQRKWENPPLQDEHRDLFISSCSDHKYDASSYILPHGSYLVNLAQEEAEKATQAYNAFLDDLHRCEALGIKLYNFHPGSTGSRPRPSAIARIAQALNRAHLATRTVTPVLETMAGGGNVIGSTFEDLRDIIALIDDKKRIGVCLDTCHVFAAGYDLRSPTAFKKTLEDFDSIVGMKYLRALHVNDSKAPFDSHRDLHQNIGLGFLGLRAFHNIMTEPRFEGLPLVLETPIDRKDEETGKDVEDKGIWAREIKMLEGLIGMDADSEEFLALEKELADKGAEERKKLQEQFDRKVEKDKKALEKGQLKLDFGKKKTKKGSEQGSDSEA